MDDSFEICEKIHTTCTKRIFTFVNKHSDSQLYILSNINTSSDKNIQNQKKNKITFHPTPIDIFIINKP